MKYIIGIVLVVALFLFALVVGIGFAVMLTLGFIGQGIACVMDWFLTRSGIHEWGVRMLIRQGIV